MNYNDIKEKLEQRRKDLKSIIERIDDRTKVLFSEWSGELAAYDNHIDVGTDLFLREADQVMRHRAKKILEDIDKAEELLVNGSYGICENCGRPIDDDRLNVIPETNFCFDCSDNLTSDETYMISQGKLENNEFWDEMAIWGSSNTLQDGQESLKEREDEPL